MNTVMYFVHVFALVIAFVGKAILGHSATGMALAAAVPAATVTGDKPKVFKLEDKKLLAALREVSDVCSREDKIKGEKSKLVDLHFKAFGACYDVEFLAFCKKNDISHTLAEFCRRTFAPDMSKTAEKDAVTGKRGGYAMDPRYWAVSALNQAWTHFNRVAEETTVRAAKVDAKVVELVGAGMAVTEAKTKAEEAIPLPTSGGSRDTTADSVLMRYQKTLAMVLSSISDTPRELASAVLHAQQFEEAGQKKFLADVLPKFKGSDIVRRHLEQYAMLWCAEHLDAIIALVRKAGFIVSKTEPVPVTANMLAANEAAASELGAVVCVCRAS
jgi:hypothetical protein